MRIQVEGPDKKREVQTFQAKRVLIGRLEECDLVLPHPTVSKKHAEIVADRGTYLIRDLGSYNGTYLNGKWVKKARPLRPGDRLRIGRYELLFCGELEPEEAALRAGKEKAATQGAVSAEGAEAPDAAPGPVKTRRKPAARVPRPTGPGSETTRPILLGTRKTRRRRRARPRAEGAAPQGRRVPRSRVVIFYVAAAVVAGVVVALVVLVLS